MIEGKPAAFDNGLTAAQDDALDDLCISINRVAMQIEELGRHRNYSLAVTKLEEAKLWLRDRKHKPA
jgi:hypothetical protein